MEGGLLENAYSSSKLHGSSFDSREFRDPDFHDKYDRFARPSRRHRVAQSFLDLSLRSRRSRGAGRLQEAKGNDTSTCQMKTNNLKGKVTKFVQENSDDSMCSQTKRLHMRPSQSPINTIRPSSRNQHHKAYQELGSRTPFFYIDINISVTSIQALYRGYVVRKCEPVKHLRIISEVREEVKAMLEKAVEVEQYDKLCCDQVEQLRWSETLMTLLFRLDSIQDVHPVIREIRKSVVHEVTHFQTLIDSALEYNLLYGKKRLQLAETKQVKTDENIQALENGNFTYTEHPVSLQISGMEPLGAAKGDSQQPEELARSIKYESIDVFEKTEEDTLCYSVSQFAEAPATPPESDIGDISQGGNHTGLLSPLSKISLEVAVDSLETSKFGIESTLIRVDVHSTMTHFSNINMIENVDSFEIDNNENLHATTALKNWCSIVWELLKGPEIWNGVENLEKEVSQLVGNQMEAACATKDTPARLASSSTLIKDKDYFLIEPSLYDTSIMDVEETYADLLYAAQKENEPNASLRDQEEVNIIMQTVPCLTNIKDKNEEVEANVSHELAQGGRKHTLDTEELSPRNLGATEEGEELLREDKHGVNNEGSAKEYARDGILIEADVEVATPATPVIECIEANGNKVVDSSTTKSFGCLPATPSYVITSPCPTLHLSESDMDGGTTGIGDSQKQDKSSTGNDPTKDGGLESLDPVTALNACTTVHDLVQLGSLYPLSSETISDSMLMQHILEENQKLRAVIGQVLQWGKQQTTIIHNLASRIEQLEAIVLIGNSFRNIQDGGENIEVINTMTKEGNATEYHYHRGANWEGSKLGGQRKILPFG